MASRTLSASLSTTKTCQHEDSAVFSSSEYADAAVSNSRCVGGSITFSSFRGWGKSYYFEIYVDGAFACETKEINDQNSSTHELTTYIDTSETYNSDVLLKNSGEIEVVVIDNASPYTDDVCSFRDGCEVTIKASYELNPTRCKAPKTVTVEKSVTSEPTNILTWSGSQSGTNNTLTGYFIQYADSADQVEWSDWYGDISTGRPGTPLEVPMPEEGLYRKFRVFALGSAGAEYRSETGTESNITYRGRVPLEGFTDSPLVVGETYVKALHMQELQDRANTLRGYFGLAPYNFSTIKSGETDLKNWTAHVNEIRAAIDAINTNHDAWITINTNCPRADVIEQLRAVILAM